MDTILQPTLQNAHVLLRPLQPDDLEALFTAAKDPLIWEQHPAQRYKRDVFEGFFQESLSSNGALVIIDKKSDELMGSSRFKRLHACNAVEIGWTFLARKYWGGKFNDLIKNLMINHAFQYFDHVIFYVDKNNLRSQMAVKKIGGKPIIAAELKPLIKTSQGTLSFVISRKK